MRPTIRPVSSVRSPIGRQRRSPRSISRAPVRWCTHDRHQGPNHAPLTPRHHGGCLSAPRNGKSLYQTCAACHTERPDALGPSLKGVVGRKSAALDDFRYSNPMKRANLVWDEANLRAYIQDPQAKVKGNRMPYSGLTDGKDVDDIVAYLKTLQ